MTGLPPRTCRNRAAACQLRPARRKRGASRPWSIGRTPIEPPPQMPEQGGRHANYALKGQKRSAQGSRPGGNSHTSNSRPERAKETHTLRSCCPCRADTRNTRQNGRATPRAEKQVGPSARFKHHPTHPIEPHAHMPPARRAGRPTPLTPLQQERKKGHIPPPWSMGEIRKGQPALQRRGGAGRPTYPPPLSKKENGAHPPPWSMGEIRRPKPALPTGRKRGGKT